MRILVVDDESIVLESVSQIIELSFQNMRIETAQSAREGLIKFEQFRPQVIMTDIKMPGMNGLEFVERIRKIDPGVKIVIVTAYDYFEFAKEAVKYNVEDYILKPLTKSKLIETLTSVVDKLEKETEARNQEIGNIEKYYQSIQLVESNFFNSILLGRNYVKFIGHYREILEMKMRQGFFVVLDFGDYSSKAEVDELNKINQKLTDCSEFLKTQIKYQLEALTSVPFLNRIFIYIEDGQKGYSPNYLLKIKEQIMDRFQMRTKIGIGRVKSIENIQESYAEALLALGISQDEIVDFKELPLLKHSVESFEKSRLALYEGFVGKLRNFKSLLRNFEAEFMRMQTDKASSEYAEAALVELFVELRNSFKTNQLEGKHYLIDFLEKTPTLKLHHFELKVKEWFKVVSHMHKENFNAITYEAIDLLQHEFASEITLESVAQSVNVTAPYLSKIFKEDTGITFKEYLTELRMEAGKKLLKEGVKSLKEISTLVGYSDTNYFVRAFKKYEGLTPKDYQRLNQ